MTDTHHAELATGETLDGSRDGPLTAGAVARRLIEGGVLDRLGVLMQLGAVSRPPGSPTDRSAA